MQLCGEVRLRRQGRLHPKSAATSTSFRWSATVAALSCLYAFTDSETNHHYTWRLDATGRVAPAGGKSESSEASSEGSGEAVLEILLSTEPSSDGSWKKTWTSSRYCWRCQRVSGSARDGGGKNRRQEPLSCGGSEPERVDGDDETDDPNDQVLDCGRPVNFTYYDHLVGIQSRSTHPHIPEPEVASSLFGKTDIDEIERSLKKAKREKPKSVELYNRIGNFWRVRGDTQKSIECFRRALAVSPNNADILLHLARVLYNLQFLDDAIVLTRRSLEVQPPDQNAWAQHFQLGEILKAYSHYQEASLHLRHVLELKPNYAPALKALAEMEAMPDASVHAYTMLIIVALVLAVLVWILSTIDGGLEEVLGFSFSAFWPAAASSGKDQGGGNLTASTSFRLNRLHRLHARAGGKKLTA